MMVSRITASTPKLAVLGVASRAKPCTDGCRGAGSAFVLSGFADYSTKCCSLNAAATGLHAIWYGVATHGLHPRPTSFSRCSNAVRSPSVYVPCPVLIRGRASHLANTSQLKLNNKRNLVGGTHCHRLSLPVMALHLSAWKMAGEAIPKPLQQQP